MAFKYFIGLDPEDNTIDPSLLTKFRKTRITEDTLEEMLDRGTPLAAMGKMIYFK